MERRVILAIGLSIMVLFGFRYLEQKRLDELERTRPKPPRSSTVPAPPAQPGAEPFATAPPEESAPVEAAPAAPNDTVATPQKVSVAGELYRAVLDNRGALLTSWVLNKYKTARGEPFDMISPGMNPEVRLFPGALIFDDAALTTLANSEPYELRMMGEGGEGAITPPSAASLHLRRGDLNIEKEFRFDRDNYVVGYAVSVLRGGKPVPFRVLLGQDIGPEHEHLLNPSVSLQAIYNLAGEVNRETPPSDEKEVRRVEGSMLWLGLDMQYFVEIAVPPQPIPAFEIQRKHVQTVGLDGKEATRDLARITIPMNGSARYDIYFGPKEQAYLQKVRGANLAEAIDYGMFSFLVRPLLIGLQWLNQYVHNYGWAIVLLTLLLTLLLFPFRLKQMVSMKRMQVVQPKIKAIQEKYKRYSRTDPKRAEMNQEVMAVYKEHNVNPLGGCLPLLLQMPLLFAFYQLLAVSIELRQAPFIGWIQDLSAKDPYYVLPVVMGITMLISQKMTPMTPGADPMQAKMMMVMPAIFTVMFLNVSSGLNLYFLCSNIFQIGFQKIAEGWVGDDRSARRAK